MDIFPRTNENEKPLNCIFEYDYLKFHLYCYICILKKVYYIHLLIELSRNSALHGKVINTHKNPDMAKLMFEADFAITASGSSVWERCCLGLSGIIVQVAENQKNIYKKLIEDKLFAPIENLSDQLNDRKKNHVALFNLCDGKGKDRLIQFIKKLYV